MLTFEHAIIATGSRPSTMPGLSLDSPRMMDSTAALDLPDIPKSLLVDRRRLHRPRAGHRLRGARHQGHRRRDDRRPAAGRGPRSRQRPRQAGRADVRERCCSRQGRRPEGGQGRHRASPSRAKLPDGHGQRADVRPRARVDRPPAELGRCPASTRRRRQGRRERLHRDRRAAAHGRADDLRDWRRRRRADAGAQGVARGARRRRSDPRAQGRRSSRWRFRPSSSPIRRSRGAA